MFFLSMLVVVVPMELQAQVLLTEVLTVVEMLPIAQELQHLSSMAEPVVAQPIYE